MMTENSRIRGWMRACLEGIARIVLGEPARVISLRQVRRLDELERREELQTAARRGDTDYLRAELAKSQLTEADLAMIARHATPIGQWPDEDLSGCFTPASRAE